MRVISEGPDFSASMPQWYARERLRKPLAAVPRRYS